MGWRSGSPALHYSWVTFWRSVRSYGCNLQEQKCTRQTESKAKSFLRRYLCSDALLIWDYEPMVVLCFTCSLWSPGWPRLSRWTALWLPPSPSGAGPTESRRGDLKHQVTQSAFSHTPAIIHLWIVSTSALVTQPSFSGSALELQAVEASVYQALCQLHAWVISETMLSIKTSRKVCWPSTMKIKAVLLM